MVSSKKADNEMSEYTKIQKFIKNLSDAELRKLCYEKEFRIVGMGAFKRFRIGGYDGVTSIVFDELQKRKGLCAQFYRHFNHKIGDYFVSSLAGKRLCHAPTKNGICTAPMELDELFMNRFGLKWKEEHDVQTRNN